MKTPEICLTPKILPADHALGRYDPKSNRVFFSSSELFRYDEETQVYAVYHELGHWFRQTRVPRGLIALGWNYGTKDGEEGFADMFALYFLSPGGLKKSHSEALAVIERFMEGDAEKIESFAESVIDEIKKRSAGDCTAVRCSIVASRKL